MANVLLELLLCLSVCYYCLCCRNQDLKNITKDTVVNIPHDIRCDKEYFIRHVVNYSLYINKEYLRRLQEVCEPQNILCSGGLIRYTQFMGRSKTQYIFLQWLKLNTSTSGCWGYMAEYLHGNNIYYEFIDFNEQYAKTCSAIEQVPNTTFIQRLYPLPTGHFKQLTGKSLGQCRIDVIQAINYDHVIKISKNCTSDDKYNVMDQIINLAKQICKYHPTSISDREKAYKLVKRVKCQYIYIYERVTSFKQVTNNRVRYILVGVLCLLVVCLVVTVLINCKLRKRKHVPFDNKEDSETDQTTELTKVGNHTALILYRPGCRYLENFIKIFCNFLNTYGINTNSPQESSEEGVAAYMLKNIGTCDYILMMCSEPNEALPIMTHEMYEYALRAAGWLTYHRNMKKCRYIPIYLSNHTYKFSFFQNFGILETRRAHEIPEEFHKLLQLILCAENVTLSPDSVELNEMKLLSEYISAASHPKCLKDTCVKGVKGSNNEACDV